MLHCYKSSGAQRRQRANLEFSHTWVSRLRVETSHCPAIAWVSRLRVFTAHAVSTIARVSRLRVVAAHAESAIPWVAGLDWWRAPGQDVVGY